MKNKLFFHALLIVCMTQGLYGQKSAIDYDLAGYKLPVMKRHVLELQFGLYAQNRKSNYQNNTDTTNYSNISFNSTVTPNYSFYLNTQKFQVNSNITFSPLYYNYQKSEDTMITRINKTYNPSINYNGNHSYYFVKKFFVEADLNLNYQYNNYKSEITGVPMEDKTTSTNSHFFVSVPIMVGRGRIERVEDARLAVYILSDLKKAGKIDTDLTKDEITQFATFISELKNERFFDDREKKIYELQQMDSFLVSHNIVKSPDITCFSLMNDNWDYAAGPIRKSGFKVDMGVSPSYSDNNLVIHDNIDSTMYHKDKIETSHFNGTVTIEYEKPLNLFWQLSVTEMVSAGKRRINITSADYNFIGTSKTNNWNLRNYLNAFLNYYPNSRTEMSLGTSLTYNLSNYKDLNATPDMDDSYYNSLNEIVSLNISYYISPRVRFSFNSSYNYNFLNDETENPNGNIKSKSKLNNLAASASLIYKIL
jgi:hypothetical protein